MDMRLQLMLGHLPALVHRDPNPCWWSDWVGSHGRLICSLSRDHRIVVAEIEPLVPAVISRYFGDYNNNVVRDPRSTSCTTMPVTTS